MREPWWEDAVCRGLDPAIWFPEHPEIASSYDIARKLCEVCPVEHYCLEDALKAENHRRDGMFGGMTPYERSVESQNRGIVTYERESKVPVLLTHGTRTGYERERRMHLPTCDECRAAKATYKRMESSGG